MAVLGIREIRRCINASGSKDEPVDHLCLQPCPWRLGTEADNIRKPK
jgi:hypothetical protein